MFASGLVDGLRSVLGRLTRCLCNDACDGGQSLRRTEVDGHWNRKISHRLSLFVDGEGRTVVSCVAVWGCSKSHIIINSHM